MKRRNILQLGLASFASGLCHDVRCTSLFADQGVGQKPPFMISLAQWSLHRTIRAGELDPLDFAKTSKQTFGIDAIEYVNQFFMDKATDQAYMAELKKRADDHGVKSLLIMCDNEGHLGDPDATKRRKAVENHFKWVEAAKFLGGHSIRVNAHSRGTFEEQQKWTADGLRQLSQFAQPLGMNVLVENHGGLSSHGQWLAGVIKMVGMENCGTLPDFGNFTISRGPEPVVYDRYQGVQELMPFAKAVSAKTMDFDSEGNETTIDYPRMMAIVLDHGYHGYVGVEYSGRNFSEFEGIAKSKRLLERIAANIAAK